VVCLFHRLPCSRTRFLARHYIGRRQGSDSYATAAAAKGRCSVVEDKQSLKRVGNDRQLSLFRVAGVIRQDGGNQRKNPSPGPLHPTSAQNPDQTGWSDNHGLATSERAFLRMPRPAFKCQSRSKMPLFAVWRCSNHHKIVTMPSAILFSIFCSRC